MIRFQHVAIALAAVLPLTAAFAQSVENRPPIPIVAGQAAPPGQTPEGAELARLQAEYVEARTAHFKPLMDARGRGDTGLTMDPEKHPGRQYHPRFRALALRFGLTEDGFNAWDFAVRAAHESSDVGARDAAIEEILQRFANTPQLGAYLLRVPIPGTTLAARGPEVAEKTEAFLARVERQNTHPEVLAGVMARRAVAFHQGDEAKTTEINRQIVARYPDTQAGKRAAAALFELENLVPGKMAPDFEATDINGEKFRLSDYRGKVVVLEFWGFW